MSNPPTTANLAIGAAELASTMINRGLRGVPAVDEDRVVGIITRSVTITDQYANPPITTSPSSWRKPSPGWYTPRTRTPPRGGPDRQCHGH
jgi:hypothetical protein